MSCKWDREALEYLNDGDPCKVDAYGDPTRHCTTQKSCAEHVGPNELTCARCIGRVRTHLRRIPALAALAVPIALTVGVNSEVVNIAGPAADPEAWSWRKIAARQGGSWHVSLPCRLEHVHRRCGAEDDDELHPYSVLTRWEFMVREDYDHPRDTETSIASAAAYLERQLGRIAQDDGQDFPLFAREIRKCRRHLESAMSTSLVRERGVPCPECTTPTSGVGPRLTREYGHWCDDPECCREHVSDDTADRWVCPRNQQHAWTPSAYESYIEERRGA